MDAAIITVIAREEIRDSLRNRWFLLYAAAFAFLALAVSWISLAGSGGYGFAGYGKTAAGLVNLVLLVVPLGAATGLEHRLRPRAEGVFHFCAHAVALVPGLPGAYLRRAFYRLTLDECHGLCHIGFGAMFTHRTVKVGRGVYDYGES